jgi:hypothetical protein
VRKSGGTFELPDDRIKSAIRVLRGTEIAQARVRLGRDGHHMKNLAIYLAAGATALFMTAASAAPLSAEMSLVAPESNIQNVRMVCSENGRCWRERSERRVIVREPGDSYGYAPRERYIERRGYEDRGGIGFRAPGVSVGIGTDRY